MALEDFLITRSRGVRLSSVFGNPFLHDLLSNNINHRPGFIFIQSVDKCT